MWWVSLLSLRNLARIGSGLVVGGAAMALAYLPFTTLTAILVSVALVAGGLSFAATFMGERRARLEAVRFAQLHGWTYERQLSGLFSRLGTAPFNAPEIAYTHVVTGRFGGFECFDGLFEWRVRLDEDTTVSGRHRVAAVRMPDELPRVMLVPEGVTARVAKLFGGADRDFESSTFNRRWRVLADDSKIAHDLLSPRVIDKLEGMSPRAPMLFEAGFGVRIDDDSVGIGSLSDRLGGIIAVARLVPQHTVDDHGRLANSIGPLPSVATPGALTSGYNPAILESDDRHLRTAKPRKHQKWVDMAHEARAVDTPQSGLAEPEPVVIEPDAL